MSSLHIAVTVDPYIPVPPDEYGGIERIVEFVVNGLAARGHQVTLIAHPDSRCAGELVGYGAPPHFTPSARIRELWQVGAGLVRRARSLDAVLSWGRLAALAPILPLRRLAKLQRYCRDGIPWRSVSIASAAAGDSIEFVAAAEHMYREKVCSSQFAACSRDSDRISQQETRAKSEKRPEANFGKWLTIYDGIRLENFRPQPAVNSDAPLVFLGRLETYKGAHNAIEIARRSKRRLFIAGNRVEKGSNIGYFQKEIEPRLDGEQIHYVGPVNDTQKNEILGQSAALLMPIEWDEPFGIVMIEAMACGTPVIAFDRGSVPEIVRDGKNGFRCRSLEEAVGAISRLPEINRAGVRADCAARFSSEKIVDDYERAIVELIDKCRNR